MIETSEQTVDRLGREIEREYSLIDSKSFALLLIVGAEIMIFAGLLTAFQVLKVQQVMWPPYGMPKFPVAITGLNTVILFLSGFFFESFLKKNNLRPLLISSLLSLLTFVAIQLYEWTQLVEFGLDIVGGVYGGIYLIVIGFHALHVAFALGWMTIHTFKKWENHKLIRIYLWFVILIWPFVYGVVYF